MDALFRQFYYRIYKGLLLSLKALEVVGFEFVFELIVDQALSHEFAYHDLNFSLLFQEDVIFTNLYLIVLY